MKYMKLGFKTDILRTEDNITSIGAQIPCDVVFQVDDAKFYLHKFPLLSKCGRLQKLVSTSECERNGAINIEGLPGGAEAFKICVKFCYGITITLHAHNIVSIRCAAEFLEMTESVEKGNLIFKLEVFLNSSLLRSWKDTIATLQTTKPFYPFSEDLKVPRKCLESIAWMTSVDLSRVEWSFTYTRLNPSSSKALSLSPPWNGIESERHQSAPLDWWVEDLCELDIDLFARAITAIESNKRTLANLIADALQSYTRKWLPEDEFDLLTREEASSSSTDLADDYHKREVLEAIVSLLPKEKSSCSCSFLSTLLKATSALGGMKLARVELARKIGLQLEEASLNDLLIPPQSQAYSNALLYDVDLVQCIVEHYLAQDRCLSHKPNELKVGKIIDGYLAQIARDPHLPLQKFFNLADSIPEFARPTHDAIYRAVDVYLKEHLDLSKCERKKICGLIDCKKLSMDACMHAAQNERLPLRVVVQVLFFERLQAATSRGGGDDDLPSDRRAQEQRGKRSLILAKEDDDHEVGYATLIGDLESTRSRLAEVEREKENLQHLLSKQVKYRPSLSLPLCAKGILNKIWPAKMVYGRKTSSPGNSVSISQGGNAHLCRM